MNLIVLELPEDKSKWPTWFETQLVGPDLRLLVRQLELLAGTPSSLADGKTWDDHLNAVRRKWPRLRRAGSVVPGACVTAHACTAGRRPDRPPASLPANLPRQPSLPRRAS